MSNLLRISPEATEFINELFDREEEEKALVIIGVVVGSVRDWSAKMSIETVIDAGKKAIGNLPPKVTIEYQLNTIDLKRLPPKDVHVVNGVNCYLPEDMRRMLGSREIVLENGKLQFEPRLEPREVEWNAKREE